MNSLERKNKFVADYRAAQAAKKSVMDWFLEMKNVMLPRNVKMRIAFQAVNLDKLDKPVDLNALTEGVA